MYPIPLTRRFARTGAALTITCAALNCCGCGATLAVLPPTLPNGAVGALYSEQLSADGQAPFQWRIAAGTLPDGLDMDPDTGEITGIPLADGTFTFTVGVQDSNFLPGSGEREYVLTIHPELTMDAALSDARVNETYSDAPVADGGVAPYLYESVGLPAGLSMDQDTGEISGTPLLANTGIQLEITVTDSGTPQQSVTRQTVLVVRPLTVEIATAALPDGEAGSAYSAQIEAVNGIPPYAWSITAGSLPQGSPQVRLNLNTGLITGTPIESGTFEITVSVTDSDSPEGTDSVELVLEIEP